MDCRDQGSYELRRATQDTKKDQEEEYINIYMSYDL